MYTVSKGPSKIVAKSRRGLTQNYEKFETIKESSRDVETNVGPRPVFQPTKRALTSFMKPDDVVDISPESQELVEYINDSWNVIVANNPYDEKKYGGGVPDNPPPNKADSNNNVTKSVKLTNGGTDFVTSPDDDGLVMLRRVPSVTLAPTSPKAADELGPGKTPIPIGPAVYCVEPPSPALSDFQPFDLEGWWGRRLFRNITENI